MTCYLLAGPAEEPVSLAEARAFLRLDDIAEDDLVQTLIGAARLHVEAVTGKALLAQSWRLVLDCWPQSRMVALPVSPFISLTEITAYDLEGEPHAVPADLKGAMLVLVAYWFEHRDAVIAAGAGSVVPSGFDRLVAGHKRVRL